MSLWPVFTGSSKPHDGIDQLPAPPPWRAFDGGPALATPAEHEDEAATSPDRRHRARTYIATDEAVQLVNAALYLRRPLLVTGPPGSGKSSLAYAVAHELMLGPVLRWNITSRTVLHDGLYAYDPLSRLYAAGRRASAAARGEEAGHEPSKAGAGGETAGTGAGDLEDHLRLGPLGTALLPYRRPRVLLIDEIDKSDLDLPNDLLNILEEGQYEIPELVRATRHTPSASVLVDGTDERVTVRRGRVRCRAFPFTVLTSNGEREFPPAFLRRCVRLELHQPREAHLEKIVRAHLGEPTPYAQELIAGFLDRGSAGELATDQLLNAIYLTGAAGLDGASRDALAQQLMPYLSRGHQDDAGF
ncbi:MoxR family ATPase [Streptomyces sp. YC504]|uniref:MoxR family ATPase n=1 Tax=Streptomyces mesophilus TaxID=1775132 RepID=A0A6G4XXH4_9ACTN|nr:MoxR family ATPase [Streptomyces mesophilus]NGO81470.1 MoxR family ATPase [Streptomyces mesophilus]